MMRSIANVVATLTNEETLLIKSQVQFPHATRTYYRNHKRLERIRHHRYLLTAPIGELEEKRHEARSNWLVKCNDAENDPWASKPLAIYSLAGCLSMTPLIWLNPAPSLLAVAAVGSFLIPIKTTLHILAHHFRIEEHSEKLDALTALLDCRKRDEAPDDEVLNKL